MTSLAYEKWQASTEAAASRPVFRALHEARLDSFLADSQDDGVMVIDCDGVIVDCNLALCRRTGFSRSEVLDQPMVEFVVPSQRRRISAAIDDALNGDGVRARAHGMERSRETSALAITFIPLFDEQRAVVGALAITQNTDEALEASRQRERDGALLGLASQVAGFVGWSLDLCSGELGWSGDLPDARGSMPTDRDDLEARLSAVDRARFARALDRCARSHRALDLTLAVRLPSGERHLRLVGKASTAAGASAPRVSGAALDVTAAVVEQRQRVAVEDLLSSTVNAMTDGFAVLDAAWNVSFVNDRMAEFVGLGRDAIIGSSVWQVLPELNGTDFEQAFRDAVRERSTVQCRGWSEEWQAWLEVTAYPSGGGLAVHLRDITEAETARLAYEQAQDQLITLGKLLDISRDAIVVCDLEHRIRYANAGAIARYGWNAADIIGMDASSFVDIDRAQREEATATVLALGHWSGRVQARTADGRELVMSSRWQLMRDESGAPESILSVSVDITEEVAREEALRRAERLESLGSFAGGIAHDLSNVLTPITLAAQLLGQSLEGTSEAETAGMIETAARRGASMVRQVLAFARGVEQGSETVDMVALLAELGRMVGDTLPATVALALSPPPAGTSVIGDATQLLQVLTNLVSNARDAIGAATGTITVDARIEQAAATAGDQLVIDVVDTGHGMSPEVIVRLWEPFFTTKPVGKGTGLGLPMVAAIVRAHGGAIEVYSDGATGSRFTVTLPIAAAPPIAGGDEALEREDLLRGEGRSVLVVDDEEAVRTLVRQVLVAYGYRVRTARSGDEALRMLLESVEQPDIVLSDITMPGRDGVGLISALMDASITTPVVLMSGREDAGSIPEAVRRRTAGFLVKPLTTSALLMAVHAALNPRARAGRS